MENAGISFSQWLKRQRRAHDLTQEELASRVGVALVTLRKIESGERRPSKESAQRLAEVLDVPEAERAHFVAFARAVFPDEVAPPPPLAAPDTAIPPARTEAVRPARSHNLPVQLTSFVGREREIAQVLGLLERTRLLTLTGAGGSGKTRLALQVAGRVVADSPEAFPDGVWLADLARLADPNLVPQAIGSALGLRDEARRPVLDQLVDYLRSRQLLLLLDNCEHLIAACAAVADTLLRAGAGLKILASSREPLAIDGELTFSVPALQLPDPQHLPPLDQTIQFEAIRLFSDRARSARPGFVITAANATPVAEICQRLDGMPLAIELAVSRVKLLPVTELRARLAESFELLTGGSRVALPRHQTLRATIEWSYGLLSEPEAALLRSLAVFAGGWTLESAEAVCAPCVGDPGVHDGVLDALTHLVDKSLVVPEWRGRSDRYGMLETLRQFAVERLEQSDEAVDARRRHADYFVALAEAAEPMLMSTEQRAWQARLEDEHNNIQVALDWLASEEARRVMSRPQVAALRLAGALWRYWEVRGHMAEGQARLTPLLEALDPDVAPAVLARAHLGAGVCAYYQGDYPGGAAHYEASLGLYRAAGDERAAMRVLIYLGWLHTDRGDFARARGLLEEAVRISRTVGDRQGDAWATARLGIVAFWAGDPAKAVPLLEHSLALTRELHDDLGTGWWLMMLGMVVMILGELERAEELLEGAVAQCQELGDRRDGAISVASLGLVALLRGENEGALLRINTGAVVFRELQDPLTSVYALYEYAVYFAGSEPAATARLGAAALAISEAKGFVIPLGLFVHLQEIMATLRTTMGDDAFNAACEEGRRLSLAEALDIGLAMGRAAVD